MLIVVALLAVARLAALAMGSGVVIGCLSIGLAVLGLLLLAFDAIRARLSADPRRPAPAEHRLTAGDELFGEHDVIRDMIREERAVSPDMLGTDVAHAELIEDLRRHHRPRVRR